MNTPVPQDNSAAGVEVEPAIVDREKLIELTASQRIGLDASQPASKLLNDVLASAVRMGATDIHIESREHAASLRFRINGVMREVASPISADSIRHITNCIKVLSDMNITEARRAQDGSLHGIYSDDHTQRKVNFRACVIPTVWGESAAIRVLDPMHFQIALDRLGMDESMLSRFRNLIRFPAGMLLVTGPTGSGKTTTLYCAIREMERRDDIKIMTVEDPVEYLFDSVSQTHVTKQMGFADTLRAFLRQNADVLLVGEIRDSETAEVAIRAATTGHLILCTVHTKDSISAIARLRALGVPDDYLSTCLIGVLGQRLVRRICSRCKAPWSPPKELASLFFSEAVPQCFKGSGCEECDGTGYRGQVGLFELFVPDDEIMARIAEGESVYEIRRRAASRGFNSLAADALEKVARGLISLTDVARKIPPINF